MDTFKKFIITNCINSITLLCVLALYPKNAFVGNIVLIFLLIYILFSNYQLIVQSNDITVKLKNSDKNDIFEYEINEIIKSIKCVESQKETYKEYNTDSSIKKSYNLIYEKIYQNADKAIKFMSQYDYINCPSSNYLKKIIKNNQELIHKLTELNDLILKVNDSTSDIDISYIDDMLDAMKTVLKED